MVKLSKEAKQLIYAKILVLRAGESVKNSQGEPVITNAKNSEQILKDVNEVATTLVKSRRSKRKKARPETD